jgi:hypothetical protein
MGIRFHALKCFLNFCRNVKTWEMTLILIFVL